MNFKKLIVYLVPLALIVYAMSPFGVSAAQITARSLTITSSAPSVAVDHQFLFTIPTSGNVGSIQFQYCTSPIGSCVMPSGLITTSATLTSQTGETGFSIIATANGTPYLSRTAALVSGPVIVSYTLHNVTNPSAPNTSFYVRISTFASTDTSGTAVDTGNVGAATANQIIVSGVMPESLVFCVGTSGTDCTNLTGTTVDLGVFSPTLTSTGTSLMSASTNAASGYNITLSGTTLMSGLNSVSPMGDQSSNVSTCSTTSCTPTIGTSQFGTNLKANTVPSVGAAVSGLGSGAAVGGFNVVNKFRFFSGDTVASSAGPTKSNLYTNSYIVNVGGDQAAGVYTATMTYICTASF